MFSSIRHGLFAALAGFTVLICLCYTGLALVIAYVTEDMLVERLLKREAQAVAAHHARTGAIKPSDGLIHSHTSAGTLPPAVRAQVAVGKRRGEIFTGTGQHYHLRTLDLASAGGKRRLYLVADVAPLLVVSKLIQDVGGVVIFVALGLLGLALLLAWFLARRLVLPLQQLAHEVRGMRPGQAVALAAQDRRDEIGYLANRLGATFAQLHAALAREHAFTRDVSHELRTPLTVMKNTLAQADGRPLARHEAAQLRAGVDEIGATIEVLFALARASHIAATRFDLRACIEEVLLRLLDGRAWHDGQLALDLPERLDVTGNRHLALLLLNNCLGNALFHGGPAVRLTLAWADGVLVVANTVDPSRAGATVQGFQHGQDLLLRIAAALRWEVRFHAGPAAYRVEIAPQT